MEDAIDPREQFYDGSIVMTLTGEYNGYTLDAYCSPDATGRTFIDGDTQITESTRKKFGSPFRVDVVIADNRHPTDGEIRDIRDELGGEFAAKFEGKVDNVYEILDNSDDPLETLLESDVDELTGDSA